MCIALLQHLYDSLLHVYSIVKAFSNIFIAFLSMCSAIFIAPIGAPCGARLESAPAGNNAAFAFWFANL